MQCGIWEETAYYSKDMHHNSTTLPKQHLTHQEWALNTKQKPTDIASLLYQPQSAGCLPNIKSKTTHMPVKKTINSVGPIVNSLDFLHLPELLLPVGVEVLQRVSHLSQSQAIACTPFHSIPVAFKIFCTPSSQAHQGLPVDFFPCVLACQAILGYQSPPFLHVQTISTVLSLSSQNNQD